MPNQSEMAILRQIELIPILEARYFCRLTELGIDINTNTHESLGLFELVNSTLQRWEEAFWTNLEIFYCVKFKILKLQKFLRQIDQFKKS